MTAIDTTVFSIFAGVCECSRYFRKYYFVRGDFKVSRISMLGYGASAVNKAVDNALRSWSPCCIGDLRGRNALVTGANSGGCFARVTAAATCAPGAT